MTGGHESLGAKARRVQTVLEQLRGRGVVDGVQIEVDATNRLTGVQIGPTASADHERIADTVRRAYLAALDDIAPRRAALQRELADDPRVRGLEQVVSQQPNAASRPKQCHSEPDEGSWFDGRGGSIFERE